MNKRKLFLILGGMVLGALVYLFFNVFTFKANVQTIDVPDAKIAYYTRGSGEPLILLSGFGMSMQTWDPLLLSSLSKSNQLIILDYRGVGSSTGDIKSVTQQQMADDVIKVMDALKLEKASILGWSLGSFVGQVIAEEYPDRVDRLVLVSTAPGGDQMIQASDAIGNAIQQTISENWRDSILPYLFYSEENKNAYIERLEKAQKSKESPMSPDVSVDAKLAYERVFADAEQENTRFAKLKTIKAPTLVIVGEEDELLVPENSQRTAKQIPNAEYKIIDQAGHAVLFEKPEDVSIIISEFVNK